jgi:phosphatidylinositol glycan class O
MNMTLRYLFFLLWLCYLLVAALLLFTRGFLLNRTVLSFRAACEQVDKPCEAYSGKHMMDCIQNYVHTHLIDSEESSHICLPSKTKVVLILIDALRHDFILPNGNDSSLPYKNKLNIIHELLQGDKAQIYKFIADPPTTTMQRINGLMTGSLPTFVDVGSNFATSEIIEDNLIDQLVRNDRKIVFMGDDTWVNMFPGRFSRSYPYPSFNVWDLDTVDNGIKTHLIPELKLKDWNLLIAHFLGVDHCGHRYGPNHPEMARKLTEMNDVIK